MLITYCHWQDMNTKKNVSEVDLVLYVELSRWSDFQMIWSQTKLFTGLNYVKDVVHIQGLELVFWREQ